MMELNTLDFVRAQTDFDREQAGNKAVIYLGWGTLVGYLQLP